MHFVAVCFYRCIFTCWQSAEANQPFAAGGLQPVQDATGIILLK
jgi:hypothetical protein